MEIQPTPTYKVKVTNHNDQGLVFFAFEGLDYQLDDGDGAFYGSADNGGLLIGDTLYVQRDSETARTLRVRDNPEATFYLVATPQPVLKYRALTSDEQKQEDDYKASEQQS